MHQGQPGRCGRIQIAWDQQQACPGWCETRWPAGRWRGPAETSMAKERV